MCQNEKVFKKKEFAFAVIICTRTTLTRMWFLFADMVFLLLSEFQEAASQPEKSQKQSQVSVLNPLHLSSLYSWIENIV